jgi:hypothetical protein
MSEEIGMHTVKMACLAALAFIAASALHAAPADPPLVVAQQAAAPVQPAANGDDAKDDDSLEAKFNRRFPQNAKVGHLIGMPVLDDNDVTLGYVQKVVQSPDGKIKLIVSYSKWFGWFGRPVAVPIEAVTILALQLDSVEMQPDEYAEAPTWTQGNDRTLPDSDTVRVALGRR